jgi:hypothetical protein
MARYDRRLQTLARQLGCRRDGELLSCPACDEKEPMPESLAAGMDALINAIVARVGAAGIRAAHQRVPWLPISDICPRCGTRRECGTCVARHTKAFLREIGLTPAEEAQLQDLLATCRALQQIGMQQSRHCGQSVSQHP